MTVGSRYVVLVLCALAYFGVRFVEYVLSVVFADVKSTLGVSSLLIGVAVAASTVTYALVQLPSGALGDRFGERRVVLAAIGLTGLASLVLALSPSGWFVVLGMSVVGFVSGAYYSPATSLLSDLFDRTGRAIGVHRVGAQVVGFTGPVVGAVSARFGWRAVLSLGAAVALPVLVGFSLVVDRRDPVRPDADLRERIHPDVARDLLSRPPIAFTTVVAAFAQFADTASFSFLPLFLRTFHGVSGMTAGSLFTVYFVAMTVAQPVTGWLSDGHGRDTVTAATLLTAAAGYLVLLAGGTLPALAAGVTLVGVGMGWGPPVQSRFVDHLDEGERGVGFGLVRTVYIGFAALNGVAVGWAVTASGWAVGVGVVVAALAVPVALLVGHRAMGSPW